MSDNRNRIQLRKVAHGIIDLDGLCLCVADYAFIFTPPHNAIHACATKCVSTTQFHRKQFVTIVKLSFAIRTIHCLSFLLNTTKLSQRFATLKKIKSAANHFSLNRFHMDDVIPVERARYLWFREWTCKPGSSARVRVTRGSSVVCQNCGLFEHVWKTRTCGQCKKEGICIDCLGLCHSSQS